jgi:hypothetical protein
MRVLNSQRPPGMVIDPAYMDIIFDNNAEKYFEESAAPPSERRRPDRSSGVPHIDRRRARNAGAKRQHHRGSLHSRPRLSRAPRSRAAKPIQ